MLAAVYDTLNDRQQSKREEDLVAITTGPGKYRVTRGVPLYIYTFRTHTHI